MKAGTILLISLAILASGCSSLQNQSPEQKFKSQIQDATSSKYHVTYEAEANMGNAGSMVAGALNSPELYSTEDRSKLVVGFSGITIATYNLFGDNTAVCTEGSLLGFGNSSGLNCNPVQQTSDMSPQKWLENITIEEKGTEQITGRKCNLYQLKNAENISTSTIPERAQEYSEGKFEICLDKKKGYPALISITTNQTSELRESESKESFRLEAESYNTDFNELDLVIPVKAGASMSCDPFNVNITSFGYSGEAEISANGQTEQTIQLDTEETRQVELDAENREKGQNKVAVEMNGESITASCTHYDFGGTLGGDFNYTSDYNFTQ